MTLPALQWLSPPSRRPLDRAAAQRICLIKPSALGDVVQALPVLSALRARFPRAHVAWVVAQGYAEVLAGHPDLDEIISFERQRGGCSAGQSFLALCRRLAASRFDLVCDLQGLLRSGLMSLATGAPQRLGLSDAREGARLFYTNVVRVPAEDMSAVDRYWLVAEALGAGAAPKQFRLAVDAAVLQWARRQLAPLQGMRVAMHPGARWPTKRWPGAHFADIARRLDRETAASIVLIGGPEEQAAAENIATAVPGRCVNLVGRTNLKQLAAVLSHVHLLLTNDSGPMHLAAALGTPVVGLFTCTSPQRARPYGTGHLLLASGVWCAASYLKRCSRMECMSELTPERVWPAVRDRILDLQPRISNPPSSLAQSA